MFLGKFMRSLEKELDFNILYYTGEEAKIQFASNGNTVVAVLLENDSDNAVNVDIGVMPITEIKSSIEFFQLIKSYNQS